MNLYTRFSLALLFVALVLPLVHAATIESSIAQYRIKNESAEYAPFESAGHKYYIVNFDKTMGLIFNDKLEGVEDEDALQKILYDFYQSAGTLGFSEVTAQEINQSYFQANATLFPCIHVFYDLVETNFLIADYRCLEPNTGRICDVAFKYRKNVSMNLEEMGEDVKSLVPQSVAGDASAIMGTLTKIRDEAKVLERDIGAFDGYYKFFRGDSLASDQKCAYSGAPLRAVRTKADAGVTQGITDVKGDAKKLLVQYEKRKKFALVKDAQAKGDIVFKDAKAFAEVVEGKFAVNGLKTRLARLQASLIPLANANDTAEGEKALADVNAEFQTMKEYTVKNEPLLLSYKLVSDTLMNASQAISKDKTKYTEADERIPVLEKKYLELKQRLDNERTEIELENTANTTQRLTALQEESTALFNRANNLPSKESEIDPLTGAAIAVLIVSGLGLVYYFRTRKPPKEVSMRDLNKTDADQHRDAMMPQNK